jgi:O-acetyl-ADP-ribose deacetylase (regulator of RNase III)
MGIIVVLKGDLTQMEADAIVNPANSSGSMGGGVAYCIKKAGGDIVEKEAIRKAPIPVGKAVITAGGTLKAGYVIHAPTMKSPAMRIPAENARLATRAALGLAITKGLKTIAFPGMGTGVGGLGYEEAAKVMIAEIEKKLARFEYVYLVCMDDGFMSACRRALDEFDDLNEKEG